MLANLRKISKLDILGKVNPKFNFTKHVLDNNGRIELIIKKDSITLNNQNNIFNNSVIREQHVHNRRKKYKFYDILNVQTEFKNNNIYLIHFR